jgi:hypothetical protein
MNTLVLTLAIAILIYAIYVTYVEYFRKLPLREHSIELHSYIQAVLSIEEREYYENHSITKRQYQRLFKTCLPKLTLYLERITLEHS